MMIDNLLLFLLKSTITLLLLYSVYWIFFRRETFFTFNRIYLLSAAIISMTLPLIEISLPDILNEKSIQYLSLEHMLPDQAANMTTQQANLTSLVPDNQVKSDYRQIFLVIYFIGLSVFAFLYLIRLIQIGWILSKSQTKLHQGLRILKSGKVHSPYSFFHFMFINENQYSKDDFDQILTHEKIHYKQGHTIDLLFIELLKILYWFNPVIWSMTKSLRYIHEYLADRDVLRRGYDKKSYQLLILQQSVGSQRFSFANTFVFKETKRRIDMLNTRHSSTSSKFKWIFIIPALFILLTLFHAPSRAIETPFFIEEDVKFELPVKEGRISLKFEMFTNPFTKETQLHKGIDIAAPEGKNIYAANNGTVIAADSVKGHGNRIILQHKKGYTTHYSHLSRIFVSENQQIDTGQIIGLVGNTGLSTAPHLHFELRQNGKPLNPMEYIDFSSYGKK